MMFEKIKRLFVKPKIKGNIRVDGRKIYHVPGGRLYNAVKAEELFYTEEEAIKAGFTKAKK